MSSVKIMGWGQEAEAKVMTGSWVSDVALRAVEQGILGLLLALGLLCLAVFAWRWRAVGRAARGAGRWEQRLTLDLTEEMPGKAHTAPAGPGDAGSADRLVRLGLANAALCPEALDKLLQTQEARERKSLDKGAQFLGTVGANAPFLGLTGTVLGILSAFRRMSEQGGSGGVEVMTAISGSLIATAAGLMVAIPAVVLYNLLRARIADAMDALGEIRNLLIARSLQTAAKDAF